MQLFPFPWHSPFRNQPRIGPADDSNARAVLGVVPVEKDGSAYFEAPVEKAIYFQALDANGMAVQSMRSATYVHPGEQMTCLGCHEKKVTASARNKVPMALKRPPSKLVPNLEDGSCPLTYARLVEPLLKGKCISCHAKNNKPAPNLDKYAFYFNNNGKDPAHGGYRTIAGRFGAIHTGLAAKMLMKQHREALTMAEINRITLWADANSSILGAYRDVDKQKAGEVVWPMIDMDPANPAGIDLAEGRPPPPPPGATTPLMQQSEEYIKAHWPDVMRGE
jgi:cytochrome c553